MWYPVYQFRWCVNIGQRMAPADVKLSVHHLPRWPSVILLYIRIWPEMASSHISLVLYARIGRLIIAYVLR